VVAAATLTLAASLSLAWSWPSFLFQLSGALETAAVLRLDVAAQEEEKLFARNLENIVPHLQRWYRSQAWR
jgi:hypothetical protein